MPGDEEKQKEAASETDAPCNQPRKQHSGRRLPRRCDRGKCWRSTPSESSQDDDLTARSVLLHAAVRLGDVIELEDPPDLDR